MIVHTDDIVLIGVNLEEVNGRLEEWGEVFEDIGLRINKSKM